MSKTKRQALIDAGTNTFKLVVFQPGPDPLKQVVKEEEIFVKLWEEISFEITPAKMKRALETLQELKQEALDLHAEDITLFCTEAFRISKNGPALLNEIEEQTGLKPKVLTGEEEATIQGQAALFVARQHLSQQALAIDIGGGSSEFSILDPPSNKVLHSTSLPLGGTAIFNRLSLPDPLNEKAIEKIRKLVVSELSDIFGWIRQYEIDTIIGSAGVFESIITVKYFPQSIQQIAPAGLKEIELDYLEMLSAKAIKATTKGRLNWKGLKPARAPYIAVVFILLETIIKNGGIKRLFYSRYGLKEGLQLKASGQR